MTGDIAREDPKPYPKTSQLARAERRYTRTVASPKRWQQIADAKQGPCRVCQAPPPNELHHVQSRAHGGADSESNIVPLCHTCHDKITRRDPLAVRALLSSLTDAEYSLAVDKGGENFFELAYGLRYVK